MNSKEFESKLQLDNFDLLEKEFQDTKKFFEQLQDNILSQDVSLKFPAFCFCGQEIRVKFPTYKIRIIDNQIGYANLNELLKGQGNFGIYEETNVVKLPSLQPVQSIAIHCLETDLKANTSTATRIEEILSKQNIQSERCVTSGHYCIQIRIDNEGFVHLLNEK